MRKKILQKYSSAQYLLYFTMVSFVAFMWAMSYQLPFSDIFGGFKANKQDACFQNRNILKIRKKYLSTVNEDDKIASTRETEPEGMGQLMNHDNW